MKAPGSTGSSAQTLAKLKYRSLIRQSSESLAGRIAYHEMGGFRLNDVGADHWRKLWLRGGLPLSFTVKADAKS